MRLNSLRLSRQIREAGLDRLSFDVVDRFLRIWRRDAMDLQWPVGGDWTNWLILGGRGSGKTRAGAEWVRAAAMGNRLLFPQAVERVALVGETYGDVREVMIEGPSGLLAVHPRLERPHWIPSRRRLEWPNGTVGQVFSSEDPDALRGPQFSAAWADDFGYHPQDGSGDVFFHLDDLWGSFAIDAVGIDNYMPLSDWRSTGDPADEGRQANDINMLAGNIAGGEGFDWYYATLEDRKAGLRTPITDGLGKPWTFRYKDLISWWEQSHYNRLAGTELPNPTAWVPQSKPMIFTEFGCPAVDKGANQPNVFYDPKSSESAIPYFSDGGRDDGAMLAYIHAHQTHWDSSHSAFNYARNPVSAVDGRHMVDFENSALWAWDARPFPAFPDNDEIWSDVENWNKGHWLNGRLGSLRIADLIAEILQNNGLTNFDVSQVDGVATGYVVADVTSARDAIEVIVNLYSLAVFEDAGVLYFRSAGSDEVQQVPEQETALLSDAPSVSHRRDQEIDLPTSVGLQHIDPANAYQEAQTHAQRTNGSSLQKDRLSAPLVIEPYRVQPLLENWLRERWTARNIQSFELPRSYSHLTSGDRISVISNNEVFERPQILEISRVESGQGLRVVAKGVEVGTSVSAGVTLIAPGRRRLSARAHRCFGFSTCLRSDPRGKRPSTALRRQPGHGRESLACMLRPHLRASPCARASPMLLSSGSVKPAYRRPASLGAGQTMRSWMFVCS